MDGNTALMRRAIGEVTRLVDGMSADQLDEQTPCTEWKVRDLLNHLVGGATMFGAAAEKGYIPDEVMNGLGADALGPDFKATWHKASAEAAKAFEAPDVPGKTLKLPFGEMPGAFVIDLITFDVTTHAADLARATGQQPPSDDLAEKALELGKQIVGPDFRQPGFFADEKTAAEQASAADRLLAFAGRDV